MDMEVVSLSTTSSMDMQYVYPVKVQGVSQSIACSVDLDMLGVCIPFLNAGMPDSTAFGQSGT